MTLPAEVWFHIFRFLPLKELKEVMLVCKEFYSISEMETLWKNVILSRQKLSRSNSDKELVLMRMGRFKFKQKITDLNDYIDDEMEEFQKQTITRNILTYCCANLMTMLKSCLHKVQTFPISA